MPDARSPRASALVVIALAALLATAGARAFAQTEPAAPSEEERTRIREAAHRAASLVEGELERLRDDVREIVTQELMQAQREGHLGLGSTAAATTAHRLAALSYGKLINTIVRARDLGLGDPATLFDELAGSRIVYVAESHDNPWHHRVQLSVIEAMYQENPDLAIGLEMFTRPCQLTLDRYVAGLLTEEEFIEEVNWKEVWGFPYGLYRPIFEFARRNRVPLVALNAPRDLVRKVGKHGLQGLTEEESASIPEVDTSVKKHRDHFRKAMERLAGMGHGASENSYQAMCVWDETMADSVVRYFRAEDRPTLRMAVLAGSGHIEERVGIPDHVAKNLQVRTTTVVPVEVTAGERVAWEQILKHPAGDYLWVTRPSPERPPRQVKMPQPQPQPKKEKEKDKDKEERRLPR